MFLVTGRAYSVPATALRFFNVFGPRQALSNPYTGVAAIFSSRLLSGQPPIIFEDGKQSRDFVHVSDIAAAVVAALEPGAGDGETLNVGTGRAITIAEVAAVLARELGVELRQSERIAPVTFGTASRTSNARKTFGYEPAIEFEDAVESRRWLSGMTPVDRVAEATAAPEQRGLTLRSLQRAVRGSRANERRGRSPARS
jgi:dTDP-L-rhamnose 4-epimerase